MTEIWRGYERHMKKIWQIEIRQRYEIFVWEIWESYNTNMTEIWQSCDRDMIEIWLRKMYKTISSNSFPFRFLSSNFRVAFHVHWTATRLTHYHHHRPAPHSLLLCTICLSPGAIYTDMHKLISSGVQVKAMEQRLRSAGSGLRSAAYCICKNKK